ncbi:hypothetical protein HID58_080352 [Brassica napus]|uniref:Uncharacterized protein n=3 Tax=Brassica TaxID=3705 RepID=A0ABQ7Y7G4_BRANA|nr:PREDICTED: uncharacterized protein LOC106312004 [Brassica oleracea var. oleracea]KAH0863141.1 hypothetical protein HID58_080352 [Brassica napus]CDY42550.1 BnaC08g10530D [Brassica napus]
MESVFRSAREKLEKEHIERKESGKLKLQQEKKAIDAAEMQRQAVEASHRAIEATTKVEDNLGEGKEDVKHRGGDYSNSMQVLPPWMDRQGMEMRQETNGDDGCSHEDFRLQYEYRKAYFAALLNQQGVAEEEDGDDVEWDKGEAPGADLF